MGRLPRGLLEMDSLVSVFENKRIPDEIKKINIKCCNGSSNYKK